MSSNYTNIPGIGSGADLPPVNDVFDLPTNGNNLGDTRLVLDTHLTYFWNGTAWMLVPGAGGGTGHLNQATDSVAIGDGTTLYTGTTVMGSHALDVYQVNSQPITGNVNTNENPLSNFTTSQYVITISVQQLTPIPLTGRSSISLRVTATGGLAVFIGTDNTVTTSSGYPLYDGDTLQMDLSTANTIWAISNGSGPIVYVLEIA